MLYSVLVWLSSPGSHFKIKMKTEQYFIISKTIYCKYCNLIGYATRYLFVISINQLTSGLLCVSFRHSDLPYFKTSIYLLTTSVNAKYYL